MRTTVLFSAVLITLCLGISSCKKDNPTDSAFTGTLSNGTSFNLSSASVVFTRDTVNGLHMIQVLGFVKILPGDTTVAAILLNNTTATGTYQLESLQSNPSTTGIVTYAMGNDGYVSIATVAPNTPGTFTITAISKTNITSTYSTHMTDAANKVLTMTGTFNGTFSH